MITLGWIKQWLIPCSIVFQLCGMFCSIAQSTKAATCCLVLMIICWVAYILLHIALKPKDEQP